jgi:hypothetical protein
VTIRDLAADPEAQRHEETVHTARIHASFEAAFSSDPAVGDDDIRRWLRRLAEEPELYGVDIEDQERLLGSGYLLSSAPYS